LMEAQGIEPWSG